MLYCASFANQLDIDIEGAKKDKTTRNVKKFLLLQIIKAIISN